MNKVEFLGVTQSPFAERYDNFIGGKFVAPLAGKYFDNASPVNGKIGHAPRMKSEPAMTVENKAKDA